MANDHSKILIVTMKRLLRRGANFKLSKIVNKTHAADLAIVFRSLSISDQYVLFDMVADLEQKGALLSRLDINDIANLIDSIEPAGAVDILEKMPTDDVADLLGQLPENIANVLLELMDKKGSEEIEDLMRFDDDTAGGIMVPDFMAFGENVTASEVIKALQKEYLDVEMPFYLYVVDEYGKLVGVSSLRQLVVVPSDTPLKHFMSTNVFTVQTHTDQEEVAKIVARYDILAVPVVDDNHCLVGIVTVDDVIDIFSREATEDILKMAGAGEEFVETQSVLKSTRIRLPWLFASCIGGIAAFYIINNFESSLNKIAYLAAFIPVIMGMGGNIGTQSSTIVVRGLATGRLNIRDIWRVVLKELSIGLILGLVYGVLIGLVAQYQYGIVALALAVCAAVVSSMSVAAIMGSFVPMLLAKLNIDPAVATGPFVTTSIDVVSVYIYFIITIQLMGIQ